MFLLSLHIYIFIFTYTTKVLKILFSDDEPPLAEVIDSINASLPRAIFMIELLERVFHILMLN